MGKAVIKKHKHRKSGVVPLYWQDEIKGCHHPDCQRLSKHYEEYKQSLESNHNSKTFWAWLADSHSTFYQKKLVQYLEVNQKIRREHLINVMKKSAKFARNADVDKQVIGLSQHYWLEDCDPEHREAAKLEVYFHKWLNLQNETRNFFTWLDAEHPDTKVNSVQYYSLKERMKYLAICYQGKVCRADAPNTSYDTTLLGGKEPGKAAFVISKQGHLYIGEHTALERQHSTFLAGEQVLAAGMIEIKEGKITKINNFSGHYKPSKQHIINGFSKIPISVIDAECLLIIRNGNIKYKSIDKIARLLRKIKIGFIIKLAEGMQNWNTFTHEIKYSDQFKPATMRRDKYSDFQHMVADRHANMDSVYQHQRAIDDIFIESAERKPLTFQNLVLHNRLIAIQDAVFRKDEHTDKSARTHKVKI